MKCFKKLLSPSILTFEGYLFNVPRLIDGIAVKAHWLMVVPRVHFLAASWLPRRQASISNRLKAKLTLPALAKLTIRRMKRPVPVHLLALGPATRWGCWVAGGGPAEANS